MAANCNYKVKLIGALDMLRFKNMPKVREAAIQAAPATPLPKTFTTNEKAKVRHPEMQRVVVAEIRPNGPDVKTIVLKSEDGAPLAPFRAGQYVSVTAHIGETVTTRAYSLSGSPAWAKRGEYNIAVRRDPNGFVSPWVQDTWQVGQKLTISGPQGQLYYERLRDAKKVVALAGGVGITPFMAMARALRDGLEDFDLTIIYGSRTEAGIVYKKELEEVAAACDKVHVVHVLSDEEKEGYEHGFITAELIKKYGGAEYSIFMCGPQGMYNYLDTQIEPLGLRRKYVRRELFGAIKNPWDQPDYPAGIRGKTFKMKLIQCGKEYEIPVSADEPVLVAAERAGIEARTADIAEEDKPAVYICGLGNWGTTNHLMTAQDYVSFRVANVKNVVSGLGAPGAQPIEAEKFVALGEDMDAMIFDAAAVKNIKPLYAEDPTMFDTCRAWREGEAYLQLAYNAYYTNYEIALINTWFAAKTAYPDRFEDVDMTEVTDRVTTAFLGKPLAEEIYACPNSFGGYQKIDTATFFAGTQG